jgi:hypothetical protein
LDGPKIVVEWSGIQIIKLKMATGTIQKQDKIVQQAQISPGLNPINKNSQI